MTINTQAFEVSDFSGGITDNYLDGISMQYRRADNFVITYNKKLYTRPGSKIYAFNDPQIPLGAQRISGLINFRNEYLFAQCRENLYFIKNPGDMWGTVSGPSANPVFSTGNNDSARITWGIWNNHLIIGNSEFAKPMKIYEDDLGFLQVRNCGLPIFANTPTITPSVGVENYIYAFIYTYEYKNKDTTFIDASPIVQVLVQNADAADANTIAITNIPVLVNGAGDNHDVTNVEVEIYRTVTNGDVFYFVGSVTNGTTTFNDNFSDASISANFTLYTTDGTLDTYPAPLCKYIHVTNNACYYAHIRETATEIRPNRVFQSFPSNPDVVGNTFFVDVEDEIIGISSYDFTPIVFCKFSIYRLDGVIEEDGSGFLVQQKISDTVGCVSNLSIVRTRRGTFFAGTDGFYGTDGYKIEKLSGDFDKRYLDFLQNAPDKIFGVFDEENSRVLWAVQTEGGSGDNDYIYCLDLRFSDTPKTFTVWRGNADSSSFRPSAITYYKRKFLRGDIRGYVFEHNTNTFTDPSVDILESPTDWAEETIVYNYESTAFNFGSDFVRKWVPKIIVTADDETNLSLGIRSINDDERLIRDLAPITFNNIILWGDPDVPWGDEELLWNYQGIIQEQRRFPTPGLRCSYKQIVFTNAFSLIDSSLTGGPVTVDNVLKEATLVNVSAAFPTKSVNYFISFSADNYTTKYKILEVTPTVITYEDIPNLSPTGTFDFNIEGFPKDEVLNLVNYVLHYAAFSQTQTPFIKGD